MNWTAGPPWLALLAGIAVAVGAIMLVTIAQRRSRLIRRFAVVLYIGALAAGLAVASLLGFSTANPEAFANHVRWGLLMTAALFVVRLVALFIFEFQLHKRGVRLPPLLPAVIVGAAYLIAALGTFKASHPGTEITALLAASAVTSLVLGLALQPILGNFFSGLVISVEKPFRINDWVRVGEIEGQVIALTWRTTHLRTRDNDNLVIPNAQIASSELINYFYPHPLHLERIEVGVHYRTPPYRVREALLAAASRVPDVLQKPTADVYLLEFGDSAIVYELRIWVENIAGLPGIASQIRTAIWEEFKKRNIVIPFPIRTLEIEPEAARIEVAEPSEDAKPEAAPIRVFVAKGADRGRSIRLTGDTVEVGRSSECQLVLTDPQASKRHIEIEPEDGRFTLTDLDSTHGTLVNGRKVTQIRLEHLDRIRVGDSELVFENHGD